MEPSPVLTRFIYGLETEYGVGIYDADGNRVQLPDVVLKRVLFGDPQDAEHGIHPLLRYFTAGGFLPNGARLYVDVGSHPEYATGECDDVIGLVRHDGGGTRIMTALAADATLRLREMGLADQLSLFRNNTDMSGWKKSTAWDETWGCHDNYLVSRHITWEQLEKHLIPFLATRQVFAGAGKVLWTPQGAKYCLSQRAVHIGSVTSTHTTRERPILSMRDEPHAAKSQYRRLHVTVGDASMSEYTTFLKVKSTDIMNRMMAEKWPLPNVYMKDPLQAIRDLSLDRTGRVTVAEVDGVPISGVDLQRLYVTCARAYCEATGMSAEDALALGLWEDTVDAMTTGNLTRIERRIDWAIKLNGLLEPYRQKHDLQWGDDRMAQLDLSYHRLDERKGLYNAMVRHKQIDTLVSPESVEETIHRPVQTTRARARGEFVQWGWEHNVDISVNWATVKVDNGPTVDCLDPFDPQAPALRALMMAKNPHATPQAKAV